MGLVYVDTCLVVYALEDHPVWGAETRDALAAVPAGGLAQQVLWRAIKPPAPLRAAITLRHSARCRPLLCRCRPHAECQ